MMYAGTQMLPCAVRKYPTHLDIRIKDTSISKYIDLFYKVYSILYIFVNLSILYLNIFYAECRSL